MTDFAGASLRIQPIGDRETIATLERIDRRAQQSAEAFTTLYGRSVTQAAAEFDRLYGKQTRAAEKAAADTQRVFDTASEVIDRTSSRTASRAYNTSISVVRGLEQVARTGNLASSSVDTVLAGVGNLALSFGAGGAIVSAVAIGTNAVVQFFSRAKREMDELTLKFQQNLEGLAKAGNLMAAGGRFGIATELQSGDPFAAIIGKHPGESDLQFLARSKGIEGLRAEQQQAKAALDAAKKTSIFAEGSKVGDYYRDVSKLLDEMVTKHEKVTQVMGVLFKRQEDLARGELAALQAKLDRQTPTVGAWKLPPGLTSMEHLAGPGLINDDIIVSRTRELEKLKESYAVLARMASTEEDRLRWAQKLEQVLKAIQELHPERQALHFPDLEKSVKATAAAATANMGPHLQAQEQYFVDWAKRIIALGDRIGQEFASSLARSISVGIERAFAKGANIGGIFAALGQAVVSAIGGMFIDIGTAALAGMAFIAKIKAAIIAFAPEVGIPAAIGLIVLGAALQGAGGRMGSNAAGGGGAGRGASASYAPIVERSAINPTLPAGPSGSASQIQARPSVTNVNYIIGPDDPVAQRMWRELQVKSAARGSL